MEQPRKHGDVKNDGSGGADSRSISATRTVYDGASTVVPDRARRAGLIDCRRIGRVRRCKFVLVQL